MLTAIGSSRLRSSGAHCHPEFAKTMGKEVDEENWRRRLATRLGEETRRQARRRRTRKRRRRRNSSDKI